jgi:hypothetical protein
MNTRITLLWLFLPCLLAPARRLRADDTDCAGTESGQKKAEWIYNLPARTALPAVNLVESAGAFVLVDEAVYIGDNRIYTLMAMVGSKEAIDAFGDVEFRTGFDSYANILARVQGPDGKVTDLGDGDFHCSLDNYSFTGASAGTHIGKSFSPKHYTFNFRNVVPGSVIHYQISTRYHSIVQYNEKKQAIRVEGDYRVTTQALGDQYTGIFSVRSGAQGLTASSYDEDGNDMRSHYAAANVNFVLSLPKSMELMARPLPPGAAVSITDIKSSESSVEKIVKIQSKRSALTEEPYATRHGDGSPIIATFVKSIGKTGYTLEWWGVKDWNDWVNRYANDILVYTKSDSSALHALYEAAPLTAEAPTRVVADHFNRFLRDVVATDHRGNMIRMAAGNFRPTFNVVGQARLGNATEKALSLVSLLKTAGKDAGLVYVRLAGQPAIDRDFPMSDWFDARFLVALDTDQGRVYYDPAGQVKSGMLSARMQGGEAIVVKERTKWEWVTLPVSSEEQNVTRAVFKVSGQESGNLKGAFTVEYTGAAADLLRAAARGDTPAQVTRALADRLDATAPQGVHFSNVAHENLGDPDQPLIVRADFTYSGALRKIGEKTSLRALPFRPGPTGAQFGAETRQQDIDFHVPERLEVEIFLPASLGKPAAAPEPVALAGPGMDYHSSWKASAEGLTLTRAVSLHGTVAASRYGEFKAFLRKLDEADAAEIFLGK